MGRQSPLGVSGLLAFRHSLLYSIHTGLITLGLGENIGSFPYPIGPCRLCLLYHIVRLNPDRMGPLGKPLASLALLPSRTSSITRSCSTLFKLQRRYEAIRVSVPIFLSTPIFYCLLMTVSYTIKASCDHTHIV
jgi:hypothetical protein